MVLVAVVVALVVKFGGVTGFDPQAGAQEFVQQVKPGMTWQQVVDVKEPKKWGGISYDAMGGRGPIVRFNRDKFASKMTGAGMPDGFIFDYAFDAENIYEVHFDASGTVTSVEVPMRAVDLFNGNI